MNSILDNSVIKTYGYNIRVTARTKELAEKLQQAIASQTGANKPLGAIVAELIFAKSKELGIED